jgi:bifunctional DNA-binding transcriptional regulator/antitoxin component of YhaV-PrlF toxin-antitoxin module
MTDNAIAESSVTQKYQATIPLKVREQLDIQARDKIVFERQDECLFLLRIGPQLKRDL